MRTVSRRSCLLWSAGIVLTGVPAAGAETGARPPHAAVAPVGKDAVDRLATVQEELLSGRVFVVATGKKGEPARGQDVVRFTGALMSTDLCDRFGFQPAPYNLSADGGALRFMASLTSTTQGELRFSGRIAGDRLVAEAEWRRPRWYGDVHVLLWFDGSLADPASNHAAWLD